MKTKRSIVIKKLAKIAAYTLGALLLLLFVAYWVLQSPRVQTYLTHKVAAYFSQEFQTEVSVGGVDLEFFNKIVLKDVFLADQHHDTLIYAGDIKVGINAINLKEQKFTIGSLSLVNAKLYIKYLVEEDGLNLQFLIDAFRSKDTTQRAPSHVLLNCKAVSVANMDFIYDDYRKERMDAGFDYNYINLKNISMEVDNFSLHDSLFTGDILHLAALEQCGFELKDFTGHASVCPTQIKVDNVQIRTPLSHLQGDIALDYTCYSDFYGYNEKVNMRATFKPSILQMSDIAYFAPTLEGIDKTLRFTGNGEGTVSNLKGNDLHIDFGDHSSLRGDITMTGLPYIDETFIYLSVKDLTTNKYDLDSIPIPPFDASKYISTSENIAMLGDIHFKGSFTGFISDFVAYGNFSSAIGYASSDIKLSYDTANINYLGHLSSSYFHLGKFIGQERYVGALSMNAKVDGKGLSEKDLKTTLNAVVSSIELNNYVYHDVSIEGVLAMKQFIGELMVKDKNLNLNFSGNIDFTDELPLFQFVADVKNAKPYYLKFTDKDSLSDFSSSLAIHLKGNSINNAQGTLALIGTHYFFKGTTYDMDTILINAKNNIASNRIELSSAIIDGWIDGKYDTKKLLESFNYIVSHYLPALYNNETVFPPKNEQNFSYNFKLKNTKAITEIFLPLIEISKDATVEGNYNSVENTFSFQCNMNDLALSGYHFNKLAMDARAANDILNFNTTVAKFNINDSMAMENVEIDAKALQDYVQMGIYWKNKGMLDYGGKINALVNVYSPTNFKLTFLEPKIVVADSVWLINTDNEIYVDSTTITVRNWILSNHNQTLRINGKVSKHNAEDKINVSLTNFNLSNINFLTKKTQLNGSIDGEVTIANPFEGLLVDANMKFKDIAINKEKLGNGRVKSVYDHNNKIIKLSGMLMDEKTELMKFSGAYYPQELANKLDVNVKFSQIQLAMFERYMDDYVSDIKGKVSGDIFIKGDFEKPLLSGGLQFKEVDLLVNYLNTRYTFNDKVTIASNSFNIDKINIYDAKGNKAIAYGKISHDNFKQFRLNLKADMNNLLCLNTSEKHNTLYYGDAYATGWIEVKGYTDNVTINIAAKSEKGSKISVPLSDAEDISQGNFISFVSHNTTKKTIEIKQNTYSVDEAQVQMNFDLEVTPDAEIKIIFDDKVGDVVRTKGHGNIKMDINTLGKFNMYGEYIINEGDYLFTLQKFLINKKFVIENGGSIVWNGLPYEAQIDMDAIYKVRVPMYDIAKMTNTTDSSKKRVPVECHLLMTGNLLNPEFSFDIKLPTVDQLTENKVRQSITSNEEMNKQIFSLLMINRFVLPKGSDSDYSISGAGSSSSSELLSNQFSNWLSKISNDFDVGVNYRPGDDISNEEMEVALSTQLFNDRILLEGNFGVAGSSNNTQQTQNTNNIVGDFNMEYKISEDGKFKAKVYNKSNDYDLLNDNTGNYTQGVGIFYREEFDSMKDFFRKILGKKKKEGAK